MVRQQAILIIALLFGFRATGEASTLSVVVNNRPVLIPSPPGHSVILWVVWTDERVIADLKLDVYQLPGMRSTMEHYDALQKLSSASRWLDEIKWKLERRDTGEVLAASMPHVIRVDRRHPGPDAATSRDRDTTVSMDTLTARLDFGLLTVGEYRLTADAAGLTSSFSFSVRTGAEPVRL